MNENWQNVLIEKFPIIFQDRYASPSESCLAFGVECGPGWFNILDVLFEEITAFCEKTGFPCPKALQIKEKFGTLCVYMDLTEDYIGGLISMAESLSGMVCETCGKPGITVGYRAGWLKTRCLEHGGNPEIDKPAKVEKKGKVSRTIHMDEPYVIERRVPACTKSGESITILDALNICLVSYCEWKEGADVRISEVRIEDGRLVFESQGADDYARGLMAMAGAFWKRSNP